MVKSLQITCCKVKFLLEVLERYTYIQVKHHNITKFTDELKSDNSLQYRNKI